jgi:putative exporter of polyketide antibiotics
MNWKKNNMFGVVAKLFSLFEQNVNTKKVEHFWKETAWELNLTMLLCFHFVAWYIRHVGLLIIRKRNM